MYCFSKFFNFSRIFRAGILNFLLRPSSKFFGVRTYTLVVLSRFELTSFNSNQLYYISNMKSKSKNIYKGHWTLHWILRAFSMQKNLYHWCLSNTQCVYWIRGAKIFENWLALALAFDLNRTDKTVRTSWTNQMSKSHKNA